jgi:hypothetical protein
VVLAELAYPVAKLTNLNNSIELNCAAVPTQPDYTAFFEFRDQRLTKYTIGADLSASAFNAGQVSLKDFTGAQGFVGAYGLRGLEPSGNQQFLTYRDADHGWELDLYHGQELQGVRRTDYRATSEQLQLTKRSRRLEMFGMPAVTRQMFGR